GSARWCSASPGSRSSSSRSSARAGRPAETRHAPRVEREEAAAERADEERRRALDERQVLRGHAERALADRPPRRAEVVGLEDADLRARVERLAAARVLRERPDRDRRQRGPRRPGARAPRGARVRREPEVVGREAPEREEDAPRVGAVDEDAEG